MKDIFQISKLLIKKKLKVITDSEKLELKDFKAKYSFLKDIKVDQLIDKVDDLSEIDNKKAWKSIKEKYQDRNEEPVISIAKKPWFKYAAASIVLAFISATFFLHRNIVSNQSVEVSPVLVKNNIESFKPGTDKATLTLGNGESIVLGKGTSVQTHHAKSSGEKIVYESNKSNVSKTEYNYLTIPRGGQFSIQLADGTKVWLNSETQLKFPVAFVEGETRQVELVYGEAYFEVSPSTAHKGAHFEVYNMNQKVEVVGTEFNIKAYNDESNIYTTLVKGKVNVEIEKKKQKLVPNQQLNFDLKNNTSIIKTVDVYNEISWKEGVFSFKGKSLKEIMRVISRWYDVDVVFENKKLESLEFKGSLDKKQSLKEILSIMKSTTINSYEIKDKTLVIR